MPRDRQAAIVAAGGKVWEGAAAEQDQLWMQREQGIEIGRRHRRDIDDWPIFHEGHRREHETCGQTAIIDQYAGAVGTAQEVGVVGAFEMQLHAEPGSRAGVCER